MLFFQSLDLLPLHFERLEAPSIWLRDFMPLKRPDGLLVGYHYGCRYMHEFGEELFDNAKISNQVGLKVSRVPIIYAKILRVKAPNPVRNERSQAIILSKFNYSFGHFDHILMLWPKGI